MIRLTRQQMREVDRRAIEEYQIPGIILMENAARGATAVAEAMLRQVQQGREVLILCGGGNNGGDGLAIARHLHNLRRKVVIGLCTNPADYKGDALVNWRIVRAMGLPCVDATPEWIADVQATIIVDAIFGTGLNQTPRPPFADIATVVTGTGRPVLAIDVPSGLDCDTGEPLGPCIHATRTVTFVAEKAGFANPSARKFTGRVTVADIGCPRELVERVLEH